MSKNDVPELAGQVMKMVQLQNPNLIDRVEVLALAHGLIRVRFLDRSRQPIIWIPLSGILELRETDEGA